jgi:hypothetical protein
MSAWPLFGHQMEKPVDCAGQIRGIRRTFLFRDDFNRAYRRVVRRWSEVDLYLALRRGINMLEGFDQWLGAGLPENIKSS